MPIPLTSFSITSEGRKWVHALAICCYEGVRQGVRPDEIIAFAEGKPHPKLAHLL